VTLADALGYDEPAVAEEVARHLMAAVALRPDSPLARLNLSVALDRVGDLEGSLAAARAATEMDGSWSHAWENLGVVLHHGEDWRGAAEAYRRAVALDPENARAHRGLAVSLGRIGDHRGAVDAWRAASVIDPTCGATWNNMGNALLRCEEPAAAVAPLLRALRVWADDAGAHNNLSKALRLLGEIEGAISHGRRATELSPALGEAHVNLGLALVEHGRHEEAMTAYRSALALGSATEDVVAEARFELGRVLVLTMRTDEAIAVLEEGALHSTSKHPSSRYRDLTTMARAAAREVARLNGECSDPAPTGSEPADRAYPAAWSGRYRCAARWAKEELARDLSHDETLREAAVVWAAHAAAGDGADGLPKEDPERQVWRTTGVRWLHAATADWSRAAKRGTEAERAEALVHLRRLRGDPRIAGLRDLDAVSALPDAQAAELRGLLSEVEKLLSRVPKP
jgi:Flp pilus assembly protein TadD